jgi:nitrogen-specific signal transduction histidine kinase
VRCSATEIEQVVFNILRNAAQAMAEARTPAPRLALSTGLDRAMRAWVIEETVGHDQA